jgi:hypothetical protein
MASTTDIAAADELRWISTLCYHVKCGCYLRIDVISSLHRLDKTANPLVAYI